MSEYKDFIWRTFKERVAEISPDLEENTSLVSLYELGTAFTFLFDMTKEEILGSGSDKQRAEERPEYVNKIFYSLAVFEVYYELGEARSGKFIDNLGDPEEDLHMLYAYEESTKYLSGLSKGIIEWDLDTIQDNYNRIFGLIIEICQAYKIDVIKCLKLPGDNPDIKAETKKNIKVGVNVDESYKKAHKALKKFIKDKGSIEIIVQAKILTSKFKGITVKGPKGSKSFTQGEIITDYFSASNYLAEEYKDDSYIINYCPKMRTIINTSFDSIQLGYLYGDELISVNDALKKPELLTKEGDVVVISRAHARPIMKTTSMSTMNDLLDYIIDVKSRKK